MFFLRNKAQQPKITLRDEIEQGFEDSLKANNDVFLRFVSPFSLTADGDTLFSVKTSEQLLFENRLLLQRIEDLLAARTESADYQLLREIFHIMVRRLVECVSVAPASQSLHDNDSGGLFRHSLLVLVKCLELYKRELKENSSVLEEIFCLIVLSFTHDLGKIFTDYSVYSLKKDRLFERGGTLSSFVEDFCLTHLRFSFKEKRAHQHDEDPSKYVHFFFQDDAVYEAEELLLKRKISPVRIVNKLSNDFESLLKKADVLACACSVKEGHPFFSIGSYLILGLLSKNISTGLKGAYPLKKGLLVELYSQEYQHIIEKFDGYNALLDYYEKLADYDLVSPDDSVFESYESKLNSSRKSFFKELASYNFFIRHGYMRSCCWYQVSSDYDSRLVYGFVINFEDSILSFFGDDGEFKITDIFTDSDIEDLLIKLNTSYDIEKITSVGVYKKACVADAVAGFMSASACLNPRDISIDTYSDARDLELRTERNQRLRMKREAAKLQREEESKSSNLDMNDKKVEIKIDSLDLNKSKKDEIENDPVDLNKSNKLEIKNDSVDLNKSNKLEIKNDPVDLNKSNGLEIKNDSVNLNESNKLEIKFDPAIQNEDKKLEFNFDFLSADKEISSSTEEVVDMPSEELNLDSFDEALRDDSLESEDEEFNEEDCDPEENEEEYAEEDWDEDYEDGETDDSELDDEDDECEDDEEYEDEEDEYEDEEDEEDDDLDEVDKWEWDEDEDGEYYGDKEMDDYNYPDDTKEERKQRIENEKFFDLLESEIKSV